MNHKKTILISVLTTLATNYILNSSILFCLALAGVWFYLGYLATIVADENTEIQVAMGPISLFIALIENKLSGLKKLWNHFFKSPFPKI